QVGAGDRVAVADLLEQEALEHVVARRVALEHGLQADPAARRQSRLLPQLHWYRQRRWVDGADSLEAELERDAHRVPQSFGVLLVDLLGARDRMDAGEELFFDLPAALGEALDNRLAGLPPGIAAAGPPRGGPLPPHGGYCSEFIPVLKEGLNDRL